MPLQGFGYALFFPLVTGKVPIHDQFQQNQLLLQVQGDDIIGCLPDSDLKGIGQSLFMILLSVWFDDALIHCF
ncbi:MAG: hypothetical protein H6963_11670 [Chromatiaceae bacterium]|nr:hypothetical protein [Chromatiaceae bacterium]